MSMRKSIDIMYGICINLFGFILWSIFSEFIIQAHVDYKLFLINIIDLFLLYILRDKVSKKFARIAITLFVSEILLYFFLNSILSLNLVYTAFILLTLDKMYEDNINFYYISDKIKIFTITIAIVGAMYPMLVKNNNKSIFRFYILFFIMAIVLLRESRNVIIKVKSKMSFIYDSIIMVIVLLLSVENTYNFLINLLTKLGNLVKYVYSLIEPALDSLFEAFAKMFILPAMTLFGKLAKNKVNMPTQNPASKKLIVNKVYTGIPSNVIWIIKIVFIIVCFLAIYNVILRKRYKTKLVEETEEVEIEKINNCKNNLSQNSMRNIFRKLFKSKNIRTQILETYKAFEIRTNKKEIYKSYMTATQLKNHTGIFVDEKHSLNSITDLYNEAKFSNHSCNEENLSEMKSSYKNIRKQL